MKFYLIRHGKTEYNQKEIIQGGEIDSPLTEEGVNGAIAAGKYLADHTFTRAYVSPLGRTQQTAQLLTNQLADGPEILLEEGLREMFFGNWEGRPVQSIQSEAQYKNLRQFPALYDPSAFGGESYPQIIQRGKQVFEKLSQVHQQEEEILIVSHGVFITSVARFLTGTPIAELRSRGLVQNTSLTIIEWKQGHFNLDTYDQTEYLN